jgi:hypothetical protein
MAVQGLDTNGDGVFSAEELKPLAEANVKPLKDFDYFTFVYVGDGDKLPLSRLRTIGSIPTRASSRSTSRCRSRSRSMYATRR